MNKTEMDPLGGFNLTRENLTSSVPAEMMDDGEMVAFFAFSGGIVIIALLFSLWRERNSGSESEVQSQKLALEICYRLPSAVPP